MVDVPVGAPQIVRTFEVVKTTANGVQFVELHDVETGEQFARFPVDQRNPMRDLVRRFELMRNASNKPKSNIFQLQRWADGKIALGAPDAKFKINVLGEKSLSFFGPLIPVQSTTREG